MSETVQEVIDAVLQLPEEERILVVDALLESLHSVDALPLHESWLVEIERRPAEFDQGTMTPVSWSEVKARARQRLERE